MKDYRESGSQGADQGCHVDDQMRAEIIASFRECAALDCSQSEVYEKAMVEHFRCVIEPGGSTLKNVNGDPLPSYNQYWHQVIKAFDK